MTTVWEKSLGISKELPTNSPGNYPGNSSGAPWIFRKVSGGIPGFSREFPGNFPEVPGQFPDTAFHKLLLPRRPRRSEKTLCFVVGAASAQETMFCSQISAASALWGARMTMCSDVCCLGSVGGFKKHVNYVCSQVCAASAPEEAKQKKTYV